MEIRRDITKNVQHSTGFDRICGELVKIVPRDGTYFIDTMDSSSF